MVIDKGRAGEVYNIGASNEQNNLWITKKILELLGKPESLITYVEDRLGHDRRYAIDSSKIQGELGWGPQIDFAQGLKETVEWYLANPEWVSRIHEREKALTAV
jgi:dTDP-glucose 4,6-dehydratase